MNQTAQGLAALGRGPDTMLVHMAPSEVASLQALAEKHGTSLTINPETGLPEALSLKSLLPMVAGFALGPAGFGLMSSVGAGLTVGGISALTSGSLQKGLMAGLGAYGGSGLGESLMGAGTNALSSSAGTNAVVPPAAESIVPQAVMPATTNVAAATPDIFGGTANEVASAYGYSPIPATNVAQAVTTTTPAPNLADLVPQAGPSTGDFARFDRAFSPGLGASPTDKLGAGFQAVTDSPGAAWEFAKKNAMPLGALGIAALSGMEQEGGGEGPPQHPGMIRPYTYSRTKNKTAFQDVAGAPMSSKERQYFNDAYIAGTPYKAPGPEYMAAGGPVEAMSNANVIGSDTGYPQSDIRNGAYSNPYQQPVAQNVVTGVQGAGINPYTGQMAFAGGGIVNFDNGGSVGGYTFNPNTSLYERDANDSIYENDSIGGYAFDPRTGTFTKAGLKPVVAPAPTATVGDMSVGGGGSDSYYNPTPGPSQYSSPYAANSLTGGLVPSLIGMQEPAFNVPVEDMGTYAAAGGEGIGGGDISGQSEGTPALARGGLMALAQGGMSNLGSYSDGGRLLRGPGDGVSDSIPAMIGRKQQARLADGEFVVPARIVSELGNGSTEAGARQLYAMMDRVQKARKKSIGKGKVATNSRAAKLLPA
jgi:hypothetical protein